MLRHFFSIFMARNREFVRDKSSWAWNVIFPILLVVGLTFAFSEENTVLYKVAVWPEVSSDADLLFFETKYIKFLDSNALENSTTKVDRHQLDMLIDLQNKSYLINDTSTKGYILEQVLNGRGGNQLDKQTTSGRQVRYIDWAIPGILSMNMMFACLFGVGYVIVRYRKNGVLKRLKATPLTALEFLSAQVASRLWLILGITSLVFIGTHYFLQFTMHGRFIDLFILFIFGTISLISMGLIIAARTSSEELAGGLLNMLTWPMMMLSGVWFSMEGAHPMLQKIAQIFPLTHLVEGARSIMIDGASLMDIWVNIVVLIITSIVFILLGSLFFSWD